MFFFLIADKDKLLPMYLVSYLDRVVVVLPSFEIKL